MHMYYNTMYYNTGWHVMPTFVLNGKYKPNTNRGEAEVCMMVCISRTKQRVACIILREHLESSHLF